LKLKIQQIFTTIRNALNVREDKLLSEVDNKFDELYIKEDIIRESEKLPNKIKYYLDKSKLIDKEWNDNNNLSKLINDSINIEKNIEYINIINQSIKKDNENINIKFIPEKEENINILNNIKTFGLISNNNFKFKKCPNNMNDNRYEVNEENIITKVTKDGIITAICENELEKNRIYKWKVKIIKTRSKKINVGVAPIDIDFNTPSPYQHGWYLYCCNSTLYSGKPQNYLCQKTNLKIVKDEIILVMDMNKQTLKFIIDGEDKGESFTNIPLDQPIIPVVTLYEQNDSVQLIEC
jgi:hypothetical protein